MVAEFKNNNHFGVEIVEILLMGTQCIKLSWPMVGEGGVCTGLVAEILTCTVLYPQGTSLATGITNQPPLLFGYVH